MLERAARFFERAKPPGANARPRSALPFP